jgi:hypothetical protein
VELRLSDLFKLPKAERARVIDEMGALATGKPNGQIKVLDAEIAEFEIRYEMSSEDMRAAFARGQVRDTADIANWLILLRARDRVHG